MAGIRNQMDGDDCRSDNNMELPKKGEFRHGPYVYKSLHPRVCVRGVFLIKEVPAGVSVGSDLGDRSVGGFSVGGGGAHGIREHERGS